MTKIISIEIDDLASGKNVVNLIEGTIENLDKKTSKTFKDYDARSGKELYIDKIRSMFLFCDIDLHASFANAEMEFDMMSYNKIVRGVEIDTITFDIETVFVPDKHRLIIIASDDPNFDYSISSARPHLYYSNSIVANNPGGSAMEADADYQNLFYRHTLTDKNKIKVFNDGAGAKAIWVDIQHRETKEDDANEKWVSYNNYPKPLAAGDIEVFGDDALRDNRHHFHRVRVKTQVMGETSTVKGALFGV